MINQLVSIIVPLYNGEGTVERCINSILGQSYKHIEVIIIDDGSSDGSISICKSFCCKDNRVKLLKQENSGASAARNKGILHSKGKYIMFVDSDDFIETPMVECLINKAEKNNADFVMCGMKVDKYGLNGKLIQSNSYELCPRIIEGNLNIPHNILDLIENEKINGPVSKLIRTDIIRKNNILMPEHIHLQEDLYFNLRVLEHVNKLIVLKENFYHYIRTPNETVTTRFYPNRYSMTNEVHDLLLNFYRTRGYKYEVLSSINYMYIKNTFASFINLFHQNCTMEKVEKLEHIKNVVNSEKYQEMIKYSYKKGFKYYLLRKIAKTRNSVFLYYCSKFFYTLKFKLGLKY